MVTHLKNWRKGKLIEEPLHLRSWIVLHVVLLLVNFLKTDLRAMFEVRRRKYNEAHAHVAQHRNSFGNIPAYSQEMTGDAWIRDSDFQDFCARSLEQLCKNEALRFLVMREVTGKSVQDLRSAGTFHQTTQADPLLVLLQSKSTLSFLERRILTEVGGLFRWVDQRLRNTFEHATAQAQLVREKAMQEEQAKELELVGKPFVNKVGNGDEPGKPTTKPETGVEAHAANMHRTKWHRPCLVDPHVHHGHINVLRPIPPLLGFPYPESLERSSLRACKKVDARNLGCFDVTERAQLGHHVGTVTDVCVLSDTCFASASVKGQVFIYELQSRACEVVRRLEMPAVPVWGLAKVTGSTEIDFELNLIAVARDDKTVSVFDYTTGRSVFTLAEGFSSAVLCLSSLPCFIQHLESGGEIFYCRLACGCKNGSVRTWNMPKPGTNPVYNQAQLTSVKYVGQETSVRAVCSLPTGDSFVSGPPFLSLIFFC